MMLLCYLSSVERTNSIDLYFRPSKLASFAVVNFTNDKRSCDDFIRTVLRVARSHGIDIPSVTMETADRYLDHVSVHYSGRNDIDDVSNYEKCLEPSLASSLTHPTILLIRHWTLLVMLSKRQSYFICMIRRICIGRDMSSTTPIATGNTFTDHDVTIKSSH